MRSVRTWAAAAALLLVAALGLAACDDESDPVAPADSTITVSANPQTVVVPSGGLGTTLITATLRSKTGARLPDQEISFSTTAGTLDPVADTFLTTDDEGQATSTLITSSGATITARSGSITGQTQIQTATGNLRPFLLTVVPTELTSCTQTLEVTVEVTDTDGDPVSGILVIPGTAGELNGGFNPNQTNSDLNGLAEFIFTPSETQCRQRCIPPTDPNSMEDGDCPFSITARDITGSFSAVPVPITESIQQ